MGGTFPSDLPTHDNHIVTQTEKYYRDSRKEWIHAGYFMNANTRRMNKPVISIIVPVLHEGDRINMMIEDLLSIQEPPCFEVIVVDGGPSADTINVLKNNMVITVESGKGRARQMNAGSKKARADILLFLHADCKLPEDGLLKIEKVVNQEGHHAGAFSLAQESGKLKMRLITMMTTLRSRLTRTPYGDQGIFIRKSVFNDLGEFRDIPVMEDLDLMRRLKKTGSKIVILKDRILTSTRRWEREGVVYCTLRNWYIRTLFLLGVPAEKLHHLYTKEDPEA